MRDPAPGPVVLTPCSSSPRSPTSRPTAIEIDDDALILVGMGVDPATGFVAGLDRAEDGGITVGANISAAAGDVARFPLDGAPTRIEHWRVAQQHARN